ncbi:ATP-binding cassette domain-containing protein [Demequina flava]|uniref:ATP-binding cassette domain-containing protein n=1 Tax=Demequina flava TaxID=1095025 RepID=UPI000781052C|nr:ATP-binding cassette domain-containing protein [Demequina flava]
MDAPAIEIRSLTKKFGAITAVDDLTFTAQPGRVTGFLGPNGAGKSTTLRALVGLVEPTSGAALIDGRPYAQLDRPAQWVGAHFEGAFHPGRTARDHLKVYSSQAGVEEGRCSEVLELVGLSDAAGRRVGGFSMGMKQRLGLATALLGNPRVLILDESANGLDPAGVQWLRAFLRAFAANGGTVLLSSHLLSEVELTVDDVVIVAGGALRHASSISDLRGMTDASVTLASPHADRLASFLTDRFPGSANLTDPTHARITGATAAQVGAAAFADGLEVHGLEDSRESLETVFLRLTSQEVAA